MSNDARSSADDVFIDSIAEMRPRVASLLRTHGYTVVDERLLAQSDTLRSHLTSSKASYVLLSDERELLRLVAVLQPFSRRRSKISKVMQTLAFADEEYVNTRQLVQIGTFASTRALIAALSRARALLPAGFVLENLARRAYRLRVLPEVRR